MSSKYFLTKDKKLEIHQEGVVYSAKIPLRFTLSLMQHLKNMLYTLTRHPLRLHKYILQDLKDENLKYVFLTHREIQNVWDHPVKAAKKPPAPVKKKRGAR
jgi:hypothetical protein